MVFTLNSPAFPDQDPIPSRFTCDGLDISPPLVWWETPEGTQSLALIVDDPDAPDPAAPQRRFVHWVLYNIPPDVTGLEEAAGSGDLPAGTLEGRNDWNRTGFGGACPPIGRHRYIHRLIALDTTLPDLNGPTRDELESAMDGHILAEAVLTGTYERSG